MEKEKKKKKEKIKEIICVTARGTFRRGNVVNRCHGFFVSVNVPASVNDVF